MKTQITQLKKVCKGFALAIMLINFNFSYAQDKLTLKNGDEFKVKVIEISETEIKYKMYDNLDGPIRKLFLSEVFSVRYENGSKEVFDAPAAPVEKKEAAPNFYSTPYPVQTTKFTKFDPDSSDFAKRKHKRFNGPRVGLTYISSGTTADYFNSKGKTPFITQFGWQFEGRLFTIEDGTSGIVEFVPLIGGIEQGMFIPSASFLIGLRGGKKRTFEFALGPNFGMKADYKGDLSGAVGLVVAFGTCYSKGNINFPITLAFVPSVGSTVDFKDPYTNAISSEKYQTGFRFSLIVGYNTRVK